MTSKERMNASQSKAADANDNVIRGLQYCAIYEALDDLDSDQSLNYVRGLAD